MAIDDIIRAKIAGFPKEIDDRNLAASYKKWEQAYAGLQKAATEFGKAIGAASPTFGTVTFECLKTMKDNSLEAKVQKAYETLYKDVSKLEGHVAKL